MHRPHCERTKTAKTKSIFLVHVQALASIVCALVWFVFSLSASAATSASVGDAGPHGPAVREVRDPCLGYHWQWIADPAHPGRPSRLVRVGVGDPAGPNALPRVEELPVIRSGDRVTVFQQSEHLRGWFQAIALESAHAGQTVALRLTFTSDRSQGANYVLTSQGQVIHAVAKADGTAVWTPGGTPSTLAAKWSAP